MKLNLGVLDVAYSDAGSGGATTTGEVAQILESQYGVMQVFYNENAAKIAQWLADDMTASINKLIKSGRAIDLAKRPSQARHMLHGAERTVAGEQSGSYTYGADQKIENEFRDYIHSSKYARMTISSITANPVIRSGGVRAAAGYSKRFKNPNAPRPSRPMFVDTGLYVSTFRVWTTND